MAKKTPSKPKTSAPFVEPPFEEGAKMVQSIIDRLNAGNEAFNRESWVYHKKVTAHPDMRHNTVTFMSEKEDLICVFNMKDGFRRNREEIDLTNPHDMGLVEVVICLWCDLKKIDQRLGHFLLNRVLPGMAYALKQKRRLCQLDREARELGYSLTKLGLPEGTCK